MKKVLKVLRLEKGDKAILEMVQGDDDTFSFIEWGKKVSEANLSRNVAELKWGKLLHDYAEFMMYQFHGDMAIERHMEEEVKNGPQIFRIVLEASWY